MTLLRLILVVVFAATAVQADPIERENALQQARDFLKLAPQAQKDAAQKLSGREAEALKSQIIALRAKQNPDLVSLEYTITQLSTVSALEIAQSRLNSLLSTIVLTFVLLVGFLAYVLYDQRRTLATISARTETPPPAPISTPVSRTRGKPAPRKSKR